MFCTPNGSLPSRWRLDNGPSLAIQDDSILQPLQGLEDRLLPVTGIRSPIPGHTAMHLVLRDWHHTSIDQLLADRIGADRRFRSLELGIEASGYHSVEAARIAFRNTTPLVPDDSALSVLTRLHGDLGDVTLRSQRASMLDVAAGEIRTLQDRLGAEERARLEVHLDSVRGVERGLFGGAECTGFTLPPAGTFDRQVAAQLGLAAHALACDATRVVTVQASFSGSPVVFDWLGHSASHHELSHGGFSTGGYQECQRWYAEQFRGLLQQLLEIPDAQTGQPLLDDTMVVWISEMGHGDFHSNHDLAWLFAGAGIQTGQRVDMQQRSLSAVFEAMAHGFGVTDLPFNVNGARELLS